jgi:predicted dehydrogenase
LAQVLRHEDEVFQQGIARSAPAGTDKDGEKRMTIEGTSELRGRRIRLGMVGGGEGAFIGGVHRIAARIDDEFELVAGALSSTPERARASGRALGLSAERTYDDFETMAEREAAREDGIEAVAIVTPNHMHAPAARAFLARGVHVICDKPLTATLEEAQDLVRTAQGADALFVLTHNYTGYPMVRQARAMVASGALGKVRVVQAEYAQDWLATPIEQSGKSRRSGAPTPAQRRGRLDRRHRHPRLQSRLLRHGPPARVPAADLQASSRPPRGRQRPCAPALRGGCAGDALVQPGAPGYENALRLRVFGEKGGLEWAQEDPNYLWHGRSGSRNACSPARARARARRPRGVAHARRPSRRLSRRLRHHLREAARAIRALAAGRADPPEVVFPTGRGRLAGVAFVDACARSSAADGAWVRL